MGQFLGESVLLAFGALVIAVFLIELALPEFRIFVEKPLYLSDLPVFTMLVGLFGLTLVVGVLSGIYPAFFLSAFQPASIFKDAQQNANALLRKMLVVFQFAISIVLMIGTGVIYTQLDYLRHKDLGVEKDHVVVMRILRWEFRHQQETIKQAFLKHSNVLWASASKYLPGSYMAKAEQRYPEGSAPWTLLYTMVDRDFLPNFDLELVAGTNFLSDSGEAVILNEKSVKVLGLASPEAAIGKQIRLRMNNAPPQQTVVGVIKDFHFQSLHEPVKPFAIHTAPAVATPSGGHVSVKIRGTDVATTLAFLEQTWKTFSPDYPFEYRFLDEDFDLAYKEDARLGQVFGLFALLAIFVGCLGLFGLAAFTSEQRTKEIGVRKVLGASLSNVILLLSREFMLLVLLANVIAWPVAYWVMAKWLQAFAYRIDLSIVTFVLGGICALVIALMTVGYQAWKAARANPIDALRYE